MQPLVHQPKHQTETERQKSHPASISTHSSNLLAQELNAVIGSDFNKKMNQSNDSVSIDNYCDHKSLPYSALISLHSSNSHLQHCESMSTMKRPHVLSNGVNLSLSHSQGHDHQYQPSTNIELDVATNNVKLNSLYSSVSNQPHQSDSLMLTSLKHAGHCQVGKEHDGDLALLDSGDFKKNIHSKLQF